MNRLKLLTSLYLLINLILSIFAFWGDPSSSTKEYALNFFTMSDLQTGESFFRYGLVGHSIHKFFLILILLFLAIKENQEKKFFQKKSFFKIQKVRGDFQNLPIIIKIILIAIFFQIIKFPFSFFISYWRKKQFLLTEISLTDWLLRYLGHNLIALLTITFSFYIFLLIIKKYKLYLFILPGVFFLLSLIYLIIYPRFIAPLFYEFKPIDKPSLEKDINHLFTKGKIKVNKIRVINKSIDGRAVNAYFTGFANTKEIVLYDTLVNNFSNEEILAVVAHELGHYQEEHVLLGISLASLGSLIILFALNFLSNILFSSNIKKIIESHKLFSILLLLSFILFCSNPISNFISRILERRADFFSLNLTNDPATFIKMKTKIYKNNKSHILPHPLYASFYYTHPPVLERIRSAENYAKK